MRTKKNMLRIGTFILMAMFVLLPLMSSPVAALFTDNTNVTTDNLPSGNPTISITPTNNRVYTHAQGSPMTATFTITFSFSDSFSGGLGSNHLTRITVTPPGVIGGRATTPLRFCPAGASPPPVWTGTLTVGPLAYTLPTTWTIDIYAEVTDIANNNKVTSSVSFTVTVQ